MGKRLEEFDWDKIVVYLSSQKRKPLGYYKYAARTLYYLLKEHLYEGSHAEVLYGLFPSLSFITDENATRLERFFLGGDIDKLIISFLKYTERPSLRLSYYNGENDYLRGLVSDGLNSKYGEYWARINNEFLWHFEKSFGPEASTITRIEQLSDVTLIRQAQYYKEIFKSDQNKTKLSIESLLGFYRYVSIAFKEYGLFENTRHISKLLLDSKSIKHLLLEEYYLAELSPVEEYPDYRKYCFILRGQYASYQKCVPGDWIIINLSRVENAYYRRCIVKYIQLQQQVLSTGNVLYITIALEAVLKAKSINAGARIDVLYNSEALAIINRLFIGEKGQFRKVGEHYISVVRSFLLWCKRMDYLSFDRMFFNYFKADSYTVYLGGNPASSDAIDAALKVLRTKGENNPKYYLAFLFMQLMILTELRAANLENVKVKSLQEAIKTGEHYLLTPTKSSYGKNEMIPLSSRAYNLLQEAISYTSDYRRDCTSKSLKEYIFIYKSGAQRYARFGGEELNRALRDCCREDMSLKGVSVKSIRSAHHSHASRFIKNTGRSDAQLNYLTGHSSTKTTERYYLGSELEIMLEAAYGISFTEDYSSLAEKVKRYVTEVGNSRNVVQNGCGYCDSDECLWDSLSVCPLCKHFVTTIDHERFFLAQIENIDMRITNAVNRHDVEDLMTLKEIYVNYLGFIYKKKNDDNRSNN